MGLRNSHLETWRRTQTVEDPPSRTGDRFGGLPVNDEHVPHTMHTRNPTVHMELESRPLASHHEETLGKHHLTAIGVRGRDSYYQLIRASHTRKSEFAL